MKRVLGMIAVDASINLETTLKYFTSTTRLKPLITLLGVNNKNE
jgi:hypothetical protein